jgi:hypothetical protein
MAAADAVQRRRNLCRLALLLAAVCLLPAFALNAVAAQTPKTSARYLLPLLIAMPALLAPVAGHVHGALSARAARARLARWTALLGMGAVLLAGSLYTRILVQQDAPARQQQRALLTFLLRHDLDRLYTDYWTCDVLAFQSRERIICAVLDGQLRPGLDRYLPYRRIVAASAAPAYVFPIASPQARLLRLRYGSEAQRSIRAYAGYLIVVPGMIAPAMRGVALAPGGDDTPPPGR